MVGRRGHFWVPPHTTHHHFQRQRRRPRADPSTASHARANSAHTLVANSRGHGFRNGKGRGARRQEGRPYRPPFHHRRIDGRRSRNWSVIQLQACLHAVARKADTDSQLSHTLPSVRLPVHKPPRDTTDTLPQSQRPGLSSTGTSPTAKSCHGHRLEASGMLAAPP